MSPKCVKLDLCKVMLFLDINGGYDEDKDVVDGWVNAHRLLR